jgi:hypothetical protein
MNRLQLHQETDREWEPSARALKWQGQGTPTSSRHDMLKGTEVLSVIFGTPAECMNQYFVRDSPRPVEESLVFVDKIL